MVVSEILPSDVLAWGHYDVPTAEDTRFASLALDAAKSYVAGQSGHTVADLDKYPDLTTATLTAAVEMLDNRTLGSVSNGLNRVIDDCITMHRVNLV